MTDSTDLAIIGAGPAGLAAAKVVTEAGLEVVLLDDQAAAGGQIYRAVGLADRQRLELLGSDYAQGRELLATLDSPRLRHLAGATVWEVTRNREIYFTRNGKSACVIARRILLATGALERPMPFPGWTLPGVMTAGAGQILLKTSGLVPTEDVVLAGSGPLLLLLAQQYLRAGGRIAAIVETTPRRNTFKALHHLPGALRANAYLRKGLGLLREIRRHGVPHHRKAHKLAARGDKAVECLTFEAGGATHEIPCSLLLIHNGVVPNVQITRALGLAHDWDALQRCWRPRCDHWGVTEFDGLSIAGDGGGIGGALAAQHQGTLAGLHAARELGVLTAEACQSRAAPERRALAYHLAVRPFLDVLYAPAPEFLRPSDDTIACRCEEVTAGSIRGYVKLGCLGPNQTKSFGRPGMGPCQGRFCGLTVSEIIAEARGVPMDEVGYYRIRSPIKPVTLGELAALQLPDEPDLDQQSVA